MLSDAGFLLDNSGRRLPVDRPSLVQELGLAEKSDVIDHAIRHCGFVLMQPGHRAVFVELYPPKVAPLAALEAFYEIRDTPAKCIVLGCAGEWRRDQYEIFSSVKAALQRIERIARAASKRRAAEVQSRTKLETSYNMAVWGGIGDSMRRVRVGAANAGSSWVFDIEERLKRLSAKGDELERLNNVVDFEPFRA